jgi:hypothetical protein
MVSLHDGGAMQKGKHRDVVDVAEEVVKSPESKRLAGIQLA